MSFERVRKYPTALFVKTQQIALTGTLASESVGSGLTYSWSGAGLTFGFPSAAVTTFSAAAPGTYSATLTVTDSDGNTETYTESLILDRILYVGGTHKDKFTTVTAALAWKATNDPANLYKIFVESSTVEPAKITNANLAHIHYRDGATSTFASAGYEWTVTPTNVKLTADFNSPYSPSIIASGNALDLNTIDATNLIVENIAFLSTAARSVMAINTDNLYLSRVGMRTTSADAYTTGFVGCANLTIINCESIGVGISYGLVAADARPNTMRLINSYGEVTSSPAVFTLAVVYIPGVLWAGITQDVTVAECTLINNAAGNNGSGVPRSVVINGGSVAADVTGAKFIGNTMIQKVAANPVMRTQSGHVSRNTIPMLGNEMLGGVAFSNCASAVATTVNSNNIL